MNRDGKLCFACKHMYCAPDTEPCSSCSRSTAGRAGRDNFSEGSDTAQARPTQKPGHALGRDVNLCFACKYMYCSPDAEPCAACRRMGLLRECGQSSDKFEKGRG